MRFSQTVRTSTTSSFILLGLFWLLAFHFATPIRAQHWRAAGKVSGVPTAVHRDVRTGDLLVGTEAGDLFRSSDLGATWVKQPSVLPTQTRITDILRLSKDSYLLIATAAGLVVQKESDPYQPSLVSAPITRLDRNGYIGTSTGFLYKFDSIETQPREIQQFGESIVDFYGEVVATTRVLLASDGLWENNGVAWVQTMTLPHHTRSLATASELTMVAAGDSGVFRTTDAGKSWLAINRGLTDKHISGLGQTPDLHAVSSGTVSRYLIGGILDNVQTGQWEEESEGLPTTRQIVAADRYSPLIALSDGSIFIERSIRRVVRENNTESNQKFSFSNDGVVFSSGEQTAGLKWPRSEANPVAYLFGGGLWFGAVRSSGKPVQPGVEWSNAGSPLDSVVTMFAEPSTHTIYVGCAPAGQARVYKRSTSDASWTSVYKNNKLFGGLAMLPTANLLVGTGAGLTLIYPDSTVLTNVKEAIIGVTPSGFAQARSGKLYAPNASFTEWTSINDLAVFAGCIASLAGSEYLVIISRNEIDLSKDNGKTFTKLPLPTTESLSGAAILKDKSIAVYASKRVYHSTDEGASWFEVAGAFPMVIRSIASRTGEWLSIATSSGGYIVSADSIRARALHSVTDAFAEGINTLFVDVDPSFHIHVAIGNAARRIITQYNEGRMTNDRLELCEVGYNANSGGGWFSPGEWEESAEAPTGHYLPYMSTSFEAASGTPSQTDAMTPTSLWPYWYDQSTTPKTNFRLGHYVASDADRHARASAGAKPAILSEEDIAISYDDKEAPRDVAYIPEFGYPLGLSIKQRTFSWGFGRYRDLIFIRYEVSNNSADTLHECYLAPALDPDIGSSDGDHNTAVTDEDSTWVRTALAGAPHASSYAESPRRLNMAMQYSKKEGASELGVLGASLVETPFVDASGIVIAPDDSVALGGYGPDAKHPLGLSTFSSWSVTNDPERSSDRYEFLASQKHDHTPTVESDLRMMMATGPFTLLPGKSVTTTLAIGIARPSTTSFEANRDSLVRLMASAHSFFATPVERGAGNWTLTHFDEAASSLVRMAPSASALAIDIHPNPAVNTATVTWPRNAKITALRLLDETGRVVRSVNIGMQVGVAELTLTDLPSATYIVQAMSGGTQVATSKIVVHH